MQLLSWLSKSFAYLGGVLAALVGLVVTISIIGRNTIGVAVPGDYEIVQIGVAIAVSLFLPLAQFERSHIAVDFFTSRLSPKVNRRLDRFGALLMTVMLAALAWRTAVAIGGLRESGETMILLRSYPVWLNYAAMTPGLILAAIIAATQIFISGPVHTIHTPPADEHE